MIPANFSCIKYVYRGVPVVALYVLAYLLVSYTLAPAATYRFLPDELTVGDHYSLIFLMTDVEMPAFSDAEAAQVFKFRRCGKCFLTNNRGFLPLKEYDAVLLYGKSRLEVTVAKDKVFKLRTNEDCLRNRLHMCEEEPAVTNLSTSTESCSLCDFCDILQKKRKFKEYLTS